MRKKRVVIGLSGGVDSSVSAWLLKQQGYEVIGLFMINWHDTTGTLEGDCPWYDDKIFAELVARKLDIPFRVTDLSLWYRERVVDYMFSEYEKGRTPNPDVLCNREIKFDLFHKEALTIGADYIATGHYCQKEEMNVNGVTIYRLLAGKDPNKDQSYFLCQLSQEQLSKALFPVGGLDKFEVRAIAAREGLVTAERKDSQGICFVGKVDLPAFLQQKLAARKGRIIEITPNHPVYALPPENRGGQTEAIVQAAQPWDYNPSMGPNVGLHNGAHFFTVGQRKGLNIGGREKPMFVIGTDTVKNIVYVGEGENHPGLHRRGLFIATSDVHWIRPDLTLAEGGVADYEVRVRYRQPLQRATLYAFPEGLYIVFSKNQRGITPGQFAAWYKGKELVGSGVIMS